MRIVKELEAH